MANKHEKEQLTLSPMFDYSNRIMSLWQQYFQI
jgi:hypothetical protein